jgi:hypothetical protein
VVEGDEDDQELELDYDSDADEEAAETNKAAAQKIGSAADDDETNKAAIEGDSEGGNKGDAGIAEESLPTWIHIVGLVRSVTHFAHRLKSDGSCSCPVHSFALIGSIASLCSKQAFLGRPLCFCRCSASDSQAPNTFAIAFWECNLTFWSIPDVGPADVTPRTPHARTHHTPHTSHTYQHQRTRHTLTRYVLCTALVKPCTRHTSHTSPRTRHACYTSFPTPRTMHIDFVPAAP